MAWGCLVLDEELYTCMLEHGRVGHSHLFQGANQSLLLVMGFVHTGTLWIA